MRVAWRVKAVALVLGAAAVAVAIGLRSARAGQASAPIPVQIMPSTAAPSPGVRGCDSSVAIVATALNGTQKIVTGAANKKVYVCGFFVVSSAAVSVNFVEGTKITTDCDTAQAAVTGPAPLAANGNFASSHSPFAVPFMATAGNDLCVKTSGAATLGGWVSFTLQ